MSLLAGCGGTWKVAYDQGLSANVTRGWHVHGISVDVPSTLSVSESNTFAPNADIVWHGEPLGNRRAQVASIIREGIRNGTSGLNGRRGVNIGARLVHFHAVTPAAVSRAPGAVHNIAYQIQVQDQRTGEPLSDVETIQADLEAYVGSAAVTAAINGQTQRVRIVNHLALVTRGWLGIGPDQRRSFDGIGR